MASKFKNEMQDDCYKHSFIYVLNHELVVCPEETREAKKWWDEE